MSDNRFKPYSVSTTDGDGFVIGIQKEDGTVMSITDASEMLNKQQATINNQEQKIKILQQEINDTQIILEMLTEKLKGWNDE